MTDASTTPFTLVGDPEAAACEGDACMIPGAQTDVRDRLDTNAV